MKQNNYKPQIPDVLEAIFDVAYLIFDLIAALLFFFFSQGNPLFILYGILIDYHDCLLYYLNVHLETYLPGTCRPGKH